MSFSHEIRISQAVKGLDTKFWTGLKATKRYLAKGKGIDSSGGVVKRKRNELIQDIAFLFYDQGYEKTSIRDIGKALNISNSGLYYHFENKQEMLFTIIDDFMEKVLLNLRENMDIIQVPEEKLLYIIQSHIRFFVKYPAQTKVVIYEAHSLEEEHKRLMVKKQSEYVGFIKKVIMELIRNVQHSWDVSIISFSLIGTLNWIVQWYKPDGRVPPETLAKDIWTFFLRGLKGDCAASIAHPKKKR
jgi:AcrR family transcriptional regulator